MINMINMTNMIVLMIVMIVLMIVLIVMIVMIVLMIENKPLLLLTYTSLYSIKPQKHIENPRKHIENPKKNALLVQMKKRRISPKSENFFNAHRISFFAYGRPAGSGGPPLPA